MSSGNRKQKQEHLVLDALAMVLQFGINMLVPIFMCTFLGIWIGGKLGADWIAVPLFFAGAVAGGRNVYRMCRKFIAEDESYMKGVDEKQKDKKDRRK